MQRVPKLYEEVQTGKFEAKGVTSHFGPSARDLAQDRPGLQQPSLFDFRKRVDPVVLGHLGTGS